jgi:hypothetical protein
MRGVDVPASSLHRLSTLFSLLVLTQMSGICFTDWARMAQKDHQ